MIGAILTEFIGTFVFLSVILSTGQAIPIAIALASVIFFGGNISGGHFNPAVSTMLLAKGAIKVDKWAVYIIAQILGGLAALWWFKFAAKSKK